MNKIVYIFTISLWVSIFKVQAKSSVRRPQIWVLLQNELLFYCTLYIDCPCGVTDANALCSNYLLNFTISKNWNRPTVLPLNIIVLLLLCLQFFSLQINIMHFTAHVWSWEPHCSVAVVRLRSRNVTINNSFWLWCQFQCRQNLFDKSSIGRSHWFVGPVR